MRTILLGNALALLLYSSVAVAQSKPKPDELAVGSARLTLGMERAQVWTLLKSLSVQCLDQDQKAPACNSWFVSLKQGSNFVSLGSVYFTDAGRLKTIMKYYDSAQWESRPEKFASFLYEVLRQYGANGETFTTSVDEVREPGWTSKAIDFRKGRRTIRVSYGEGGMDPGGTSRAPFVTMHERLD